MDPLLEAVELPYPEYPAQTYALDRTGRKAVLAVQKLLDVIDLGGSSQKAFRKLNTRGRHDIKAVEWNPHAANGNVLASASHNQVDVWNLELEQAGSLQCTLKAHTKQAYDLNWSPFDSNLCATCSADSYVYVWDLRDYRRPKYGFKAVAGASIVQWNRMNAQVLASVHDSDVRIWDTRQPSSAVGFITAHLGKVHCIDWSYQEEHKMVTCSQDATIKVWDTQDSQHARTPLNTVKPWPHPVWRALFTPFGRGIISVCAPTVHGSDPRILLWSSYEDFSAPLHVFTGGQETPNEVKWMPTANGSSPDSSFSLSSWSKIEKKLRIWTIPLAVEKACSAEGSIEASIQSALSKESPSTSAGQPASVGHNGEHVPIPLQGGSGGFPSPGPMSGRSFSLPHSVNTLEGEFSLVDMHIPTVTVEKKDPSQRLFRVKCTRTDIVVTLDITFPAFYPNNAPPFFIIDCSGTNLDTARQQTLLQSLSDVAQSSVKDNRPCLELCLKKLATTMEAIEQKMADTAKMGGYPSPMNQYKWKDSLSFADDNIPFPRTSGGRFCGNGLLVAFFRPPNLVLIRGDSTKMPRAMSSLCTFRPLRQSAVRSSSGPQSGLLSTSPALLNLLPALGVGGGAGGRAGKAQQHSSIMPYKVKDKPLRATSGGQVGSARSQPMAAPQSSNPYVGAVAVHNVTALLPFSLELAKSHVLTATSVADFCLDNKTVAALHNRLDLVQAWSLALRVADSDTIPAPILPEDGMPWSAHPMARPLVESLLEHYWKVYDIQTVALLSCVFHMYDRRARRAMAEKGVQLLTSPRSHPYKALSSGSRNTATTPTPLPQSPSVEKGQMWRLPAMQNWYHTQDMSSFDNYNDEPEDLSLDERVEHWQNSLLLDKLLSQRCNEARRCYGNILARWQLLMQRVEVLKFQMAKEPDHYGVEFVNKCQFCQSSIRGPKCHCQHMAFSCVVCNTAVRGLSNFCLSCGHGGHALHLQQWFREHTVCPTGCGCRCLDSSLQPDDARGNGRS